MRAFKRFIIYMIAFIATAVIGMESGVEAGMPKAAIFGLGLWAGFIGSILIEDL
ncbi:hypothetical protein [Providencia sneebia]|uniref:hypothetical protein n=1 Tax=Providencia sneebia TaxID=516075 RepID=UPI0003196386